ncbi:DUF1330 domain-containing protein [Actinobacillus arthritidis]|nr:DUF1330 domain-containing protein [Actinobacillus arthritidis]WGE89595.1 DUF1330 domain-containing protein [Actinobacillus arthritidis]
MTAYVVFIRDEMKDQTAYDEYLQLGVPTLAPYGGEILVANGECQALEGAEIDGSVVLRFPDMVAPVLGTPALNTKKSNQCV